MTTITLLTNSYDEKRTQLTYDIYSPECEIFENTAHLFWAKKKKYQLKYENETSLRPSEMNFLSNLI